MPVTLSLCPERANHLGMTGNALFPDVDIATRKHQWRMRLESFDWLGQRDLKKQRNDLNDASDTREHENEYDHQADIFFAS